MTRMSGRIAAVAAWILLGASARAEVVQPEASIEAPYQVSLGVALEHGLLTELGFARAWQLDDVRLTVLGELALPATPDFVDGGLAIGAAAHWVNDDGWGVGVRGLVTLRWVDGELFDVTQGGVVLGADAGWYRPGGMVALELAWDGSLVTGVSPTERYRRLGFDAPAGVYGRGGGVLRAGLVGAIETFDGVELGLRAGLVGSEAFNAVPGFPFYASLAVGVRF